MVHDGAASADEMQAAWHDVATAAADVARRRSSVSGPEAIRLIDGLFKAFLSKYEHGIRLAASSTNSEAFPSAWSKFLRQVDFEPNYIATLKALSEVDADTITRYALQIRFSSEVTDPFVNEALADLTARIAALLTASCLRSSANLQHSTVVELLKRAMAAPRNSPAYAHSWARTIGIISIQHLDLVLDTFRSELSQFEYRASFAPEAAGVFSMLTYMRVAVTDLDDEVNAMRLNKVLNFHRSIFLSKSYKNPVPAVVVAHLIVLDVNLRQWSSVLPAADVLEYVFRISDSLSKIPVCKASALALMSSLLERWPDNEWRNKTMETFLNKRILRHVDTPRKTAHCLRIILRILRGAYQPRVHLNGVDGDGLDDSIVVHPHGMSPRFHPYAFRMRDFVTESNLDDLHVQLQRLTKAVINRKVLIMSWPRYKWELVEIVMQLAVHDPVWTLNHVVIPLLAWKKTNNQTEILLALEVSRKIFDVSGDFHRHALNDTKREALWGTLALSITASNEKILGRVLFELGFSSPSERAEVPLQITSASDCSNDISFFTDSLTTDPHSTLTDHIDQGSDLENSVEGSDYMMSPVKQRLAPRTTSTYTLRLGASEFPFLESIPQQSTDHGLDRNNTSFSPSILPFNEDSEVLPHSAPLDIRTEPTPTSAMSGSREVSVLIAAIRSLGVLPSFIAITDPQSSCFILPILLHQSTAVALATSHALQVICSNADPSWFLSVTSSLITFLSDLPLHDHVSITTVLRQLSANIEFWSPRAAASNEQLPESCLASLSSLDALALTFLGHQQSIVRAAAFQLAHCVRQCFVRLGYESYWNIATWLAERGTSLVLSAQVCLSDHKRVSYPGGIVRRESPRSTFDGSLLQNSTRKDTSTSHNMNDSQYLSKMSFRDLITSDDAEFTDLISASLIVMSQLLNEEEDASKVLDQTREFIVSRLLSLLSGPTDNIASMSTTLYYLLSMIFSLKPTSELGANDLMLALWQFMIVSNKDTALQKSVEFVITYANVDHLPLMITTLNQSRNAILANVASSNAASNKKTARRRGASQETPDRTDRSEIDSLWARFLVALSEPKRLRVAFQTSARARVLYLEICRFGITKSFRKWCRSPEHLSDRVQFLGNVCFALRRRHKYDGVDLSGPFLEADIPEWTRDDRSRTLAELRSWSECGEVSTPFSEEMLSFLRTRWNLCVESQVQHLQSTGGKPLNDRDRAAFTLELQNQMEDQFAAKLADLRLRSFWCISRIFSLGSALDDTIIAEENWLDWALLAEAKGVPVLQMMVCFHWKEMPKLLDRLYWETSENGPLSANLFAACASQLVPVCFGLSAYMTKHELEDAVPLSEDDIVFQNLKRPLIHETLAPLVVCAIFHMGSHSRRISQTAAAMLARLCDALFTSSLTNDQVKSLSVLRTHHPGLQSNILSIRCKNALIIARTVASLCAPELVASILNEVVLRWAQFHNSQWQQKQWFIDSFEPFFLALPFHRYVLLQRSESARLMLSDMVSVTRSLVRDNAPALQSMLNIWQCFAGGRTEDNRLTNVHAIAAFILDENVAVVHDDYIRAVSLIVVELYRHSPLAVLDCILQHFEQLDVSLKGHADPVSRLRVPASLLSSVLGARFQSCRPRLPSILHHTFLWITVPDSPCIRILHDILHYSNVVRVPSPLSPSSSSESNHTPLSALIQPIPSLDRVSFQWNGDDCREWDVSDDAKILSVFQRVARCTSAICDAEFVIPIEFICKVVKRWVSRAFGESVVSDWASAAFYSATHSPRSDLVLLSLRLLSILSISNVLQNYLSLGKILASAVSRLEHRNRDHITTATLDESIILQVLQIYSSGINLQADFIYDQFRIISFILYQAAIVCQAPPSVTVLKTSLSLLQQCLKQPQFSQIMQTFPKGLSQSEDGPEFSASTIASGFSNVGKSLSQYGYKGFQPMVIDTVIRYADAGDVLTLALSVSLSLWDVSCDAIVDLCPGRHASFITSILPWLLYQKRSGSNLVLAQHFCSRLASTIEESAWRSQFSAFVSALRLYAAAEDEQVKAVDLMVAQLVEARFAHDAQACCQSLLYVLHAGPAYLHPVSFYIGDHLIKESSSRGSTYLNAFNDLICYASKSVSSQHCEELDQFLQAALVAGKSWAMGDTGPMVNSAEEGGSLERVFSGDKRVAGTALSCLSDDPTSFFAVDSPYAFKAMPGFESNEGKPSSNSGDSKSRFESRRGSFMSKNLPSPGSSSKDQDQSRRSSNVIPVPCTLANLIDTPHLTEHFRKFVSVHGDVRNFDFYRAVTSELSRSGSDSLQSSDYVKTATAIVDRYIRGSAHSQIDVDASIKKEIVEKLESNLDRSLFNKALQLVKTELMTSYTAFCDSSDYDRLVRSGQLVSP